MLNNSKIVCVFFAALMLLNLFIVTFVSAEDNRTVNFSNAKDHWTFLGGYGVTHPGFGETETKVESADFILQYGHFLKNPAGKSWYKVRHELLLEIPFYTVVHPESAIMTGINFLACWDFIASEKIVPYVFAGGGFMYTNLDISGLGTEFNGNYQGGLGIHYYIRDNTSIDFNYRYHHISNAGTASPNEPLNSSKILFGLSFLR